MKVGIDALYVRPGKIGGTESYLRNLIKGLEKVDHTNEYYVFTSEINDHTFNFTNNNFKKVKCDVNGGNRLFRIAYTNYKLPQKIKGLGLDVMFFPTYVRSYVDIKGIKTVSNLHDIQYKHYPEYFSLSKKAIFNIFYPVSLTKSNKIVCISNFVKQDLMEKFPHIPEQKYEVIHNSIDLDKFSKAGELPDDVLRSKFNIEKKKYILSVASLEPHKNINTLIKAFHEYKKNDSDSIKLVLVGIKGKATAELVTRIREYKIENDVVIPGFVSDEELNLVYDNAALFISPSRFEGFGMPPVEAMYKRIPVITTRCASLPEVTLNKAIYYENPLDYHELAGKIRGTLMNPPTKDELEKLAAVVAQAYSLETIAGKYVKLFETLNIK